MLTMIFGVGLTAAAVAAAGPIFFIALAAPQLVRPMAKSAAVPIGLSALMGALLLCAADLLSQWAFGALVMPVGVVTGLIGGVYFDYFVGKTGVISWHPQLRVFWSLLFSGLALTGKLNCNQGGFA